MTACFAKPSWCPEGEKPETEALGHLGVGSWSIWSPSLGWGGREGLLNPSGLNTKHPLLVDLVSSPGGSGGDHQ